MSMVKALLAGCSNRCVEPGYILKKIGLPEELIQDKHARFPTEKLSELITCIAYTLNDEALGFLERPMAPGCLHMSIYTIINSRTLGDALTRWIQFFEYIHHDNESTIAIHGDEAHVTVRFKDNGRVDHSGLITWVCFVLLRLSSWLIDKPILIDRIFFQFEEPDELDCLQEMFPTRHYFSQSENTVVFNKRFLSMPLEQTANDIKDFVKILPYLLTVQRVDESLTGQIRRMLQSSNDFDALPLKVVAEKLHKSINTIQRHLKSEGSSFKEIKESVRRDLAVFHLRRKDIPVTQIAYKLGFSQPSAFNRAFKNWTGVTPGEYRNQYSLILLESSPSTSSSS